MDLEATQGDGSSGDAEAFAGERAASLRRMFPASPGRPAAPPVSNALPVPQPSTPAGKGRRRWPMAVAAGVLAAAGVGAAIVFRAGGDLPRAGASPSAAGPPTIEALVPVASGSPGPEPGPASPPPPTRKGAGAPPGAPATKATPTGARTKATTAAATSPPATVVKGSGPISAYGACVSGSTATFTATFTVSYNFRHVFINADDDTGTGYRVPSVSGGLGADYMIENNVLYRSTDRSWEWSQVRGVSPLSGQASGSYTWRVALSDLDSPEDGLRVAFNGSGGSPEAYTPVVNVGSC